MSGLQGDLFGDEEDQVAPSAGDAKAEPVASEMSAAAVVAATAADPATPLNEDAPATTDFVLGELSRWAEEGWIRRLDAAFARFIGELAPSAAPVALFAGAMCAHMEGRGHACLVIDDLLSGSDALLGWKPDAEEAMHAMLQRLPLQSEGWITALLDSGVVLGTSLQLQSTSAATDVNQPMVLDTNRLYLRRYWGYEGRVAEQVTRRARPANVLADAVVTTSEIVGAQLLDRSIDEPLVARTLDKLFGASSKAKTDAPQFPDWQRIACAVALRGCLSIITGGPGTGKTYTVARLLALLYATAGDAGRMRVALAAPTGKAAARLKQSIDSALAELETKVGSELPVRELATHTGPARTLHSLLGARGDTRHFTHNAANPLDIDVLVVDEASMVHLEMMDSLLAALPPQARVIFLGDKDQLASVEAGAVLGDLCRDAQAGRYDAATVDYVERTTGEKIPPEFLEAHLVAAVAHSVPTSVSVAPRLAQQTVMLRVSRRFGGPIGALATAVNAGQVAQAHATFDSNADGSLYWSRTASPSDVVALALNGRDGAAGGYRSYLALLKQRPSATQVAASRKGSAFPVDVDDDTDPHTTWVRAVLAHFERFRILCAVRDGDWGVTGLNAAIESALGGAGLISAGGDWYEGRPVLVTRNDYASGVFNGDVGIALRSSSKSSAGSPSPARPGGNLRVYFPDGEGLRSVMASRLADVETAFAMTVHKSQGSEFEHTVLALPEDAPRVLTRELIYTGITRARTAFTLVTPKAEAFALALAQRTRRASGLPDLLAAAEARRRPA
ncbi:exodeoxyribonuclease V subunit alpha [soil metagenome]